MSNRVSRDGKDETDTPASPAPHDELVSAEDLFGDLVDAPLPAGQSPRASRRAPIRVRVEDPLAPGPFAVAPEDAAAAERAAREDVGPEPSDEEREDIARLGRLVAESMFRPALPVTDDEEARLPPAAVRTGARLSITDPKLPVGPGVDLASVAERAIDEKTKEPGGTPPVPAPTPAREPSWRDDRFGPYQLLDRVAIGGMAEVFKAKKAGVEGFEKVVALKRILPHLSDNKEFVDMFVDEAKMVAGLAHPNIVQIFDLDHVDKSYYIAMEYVHGRDLRTIMRRAREKGLRMPLDLSLRVVSHVCAALEYAHRKKDERGRPMEIVHRDVSPQNILLSFEGDVKLADFGIAKAATKASITDRGALRGKLLYMSPEQAWGRPIDRRSDVFSLGIVLYEMVTETKPFIGAGTELTILELVRQCVITPAREINPRVPEALDRVIMKALARDPGERYQDAGQMQRGLERFLRERPPVSARDLARFLELLFDRSEREETGGERGAGPAPAPDPMPLESLLKRFGIDP
ncbi:MAG TPA: serine/threonine-protein kinase [Vicinamibacteria bacterium]|nr:serine/threonine-protein kinase [Vicinamibacteria bacterium]